MSAHPAPEPIRPYCVGCRTRHGLGWCGYALHLTGEHLSRRGAHFNWR